MVEDEPQYDVVLKMVLWDEEREAIFRRLKVNGVEGERAEAIYATARAERVGSLRADGVRTLLMGLAALALGFGIYFFFNLDELNAAHFGDGVNGTLMLPWLLGFLCALLGAFGVWKTIQGASEILFAPKKKGSMADR
ncbi:MAG: hypothetical protein ACJAQT_003062 [Akkermansiaceae bacterium]|jgi:hypothetical protein